MRPKPEALLARFDVPEADDLLPAIAERSDRLAVGREGDPSDLPLMSDQALEFFACR